MTIWDNKALLDFLTSFRLMDDTPGSIGGAANTFYNGTAKPEPRPKIWPPLPHDACKAHNLK